MTSINGTLSSMWRLGLPDDYYQRYATVAAITKEDVVRVARKYIEIDHLAIVIVGDRSIIEGPLKATGIAPIAIYDIEGDVGR